MNHTDQSSESEIYDFLKDYPPLPTPSLWGIPSTDIREKVRKSVSAAPKTRGFALLIVHYDRPHDATRLVQSTTKWEEPPEYILLADNSAPQYDWSHLNDHPIPTEVIALPENPGYGAAVNVLFQKLNPDTEQFLVATHEVVLQSDTSRILIDTLQEHQDAAIAAPALWFQTSPGTIFSLGGTLSKQGVVKHVGLGKTQQKIPSRLFRTREVAWADGACLLIRTEPFRNLSGFDPRYFLYVEEVDLQFRLRLTGARIWLNPRAVVSQEPSDAAGNLRYRNHQLFCAKMFPLLKPWPMRRQQVRRFLGKIRREISRVYKDSN